MSSPIVWRLVMKDLRIHAWVIAGLGVALPALAVTMALSGSEWQHIGLILMANSLIYLGIFVPIATILNEKKTFILSLPVSPREYTVAKMVIGLGVYLVPWLAFLATMPTIVARHEQIPTGSMVPIAVLLAVFLLWHLVTLGIALVTESTVVTMIVGLLIVVVVFGFFPLLGRVPARIIEHWASDRLVWDPEVVQLLVVLAVAAAITLPLALAVHQRRKSFL